MLTVGFHSTNPEHESCFFSVVALQRDTGNWNRENNQLLFVRLRRAGKMCYKMKIKQQRAHLRG